MAGAVQLIIELGALVRVEGRCDGHAHLVGANQAAPGKPGRRARRLRWACSQQAFRRQSSCCAGQPGRTQASARNNSERGRSGGGRVLGISFPLHCASAALSQPLGLGGGARKPV